MSDFDIKLVCNAELPNNEGQCEEVLSVHVVYEAPEYEDGYQRYAGGWYVDSDVNCVRHTLTDDEKAIIVARAIEDAQSEAEDYYDGPDADDLDEEAPWWEE
jgi:hypothetical protein